MSIRKIKITCCSFCLITLSCFSQTSSDSLYNIFVQKEQKLVDAIGTGDKSVWIAAMHDSCLISVEDGSSITKTELTADINSLPKGISGMIKVIEPKVRAYGNVAIISFINDEYEEVYGQKIHTQYRQTDTWMSMDNEWKIISMELFEIPKNPPPVQISRDILLKYVGIYSLGDRRCEITVDSGKIYANKNAKGKIELLAETENMFFRKNDGRVRVMFKKDKNTKYRMIERRAGQDVVWTFVKK